MKSSYNRLQKSKHSLYGQANSKKNSNASSAIYREIGETLRGYTQRRSNKNSHGNIIADQTIEQGQIERENNSRENGKIQRRKDSKQSNNSKGKVEHAPFQQLSNNFVNARPLFQKNGNKESGRIE